MRSNVTFLRTDFSADFLSSSWQDVTKPGLENGEVDVAVDRPVF